jgi:hypothetical protein
MNGQNLRGTVVAGYQAHPAPLSSRVAERWPLNCGCILLVLRCASGHALYTSKASPLWIAPRCIRLRLKLESTSNAEQSTACCRWTFRKYSKIVHSHDGVVNFPAKTLMHLLSIAQEASSVMGMKEGRCHHGHWRNRQIAGRGRQE